MITKGMLHFQGSRHPNPSVIRQHCFSCPFCLQGNYLPTVMQDAGLDRSQFRSSRDLLMFKRPKQSPKPSTRITGHNWQGELPLYVFLWHNWSQSTLVLLELMPEFVLSMVKGNSSPAWIEILEEPHGFSGRSCHQWPCDTNAQQSTRAVKHSPITAYDSCPNSPSTINPSIQKTTHRV